MIEAGFYGAHDEDHPEGLAPGMPGDTPCESYCANLPLCKCSLGQHVPPTLTHTSGMHMLGMSETVLPLSLTSAVGVIYSICPCPCLVLSPIP